jgi:hypothetical protein
MRGLFRLLCRASFIWDSCQNQYDWFNWVCLCFLFNLHLFPAFRIVVVAWKVLDHLYTPSFFFFSSSDVVDKTYTRIKITQAYTPYHLIDYLVLLFLYIVCIWIGFQFCSFSPTTTVRLFVFIECIQKLMISVSICSWKPIIKRLHLMQWSNTNRKENESNIHMLIINFSLK